MFKLTSLEYTSPESLPSPHTGLLQQIDSKADMWSLGMILHKLLFFRLPYRYASDDTYEDGNTTSGIQEGEKIAQLEHEIQSYSGCEVFTPCGVFFVNYVSIGSSRHRVWYQHLKPGDCHAHTLCCLRAFST